MKNISPNEFEKLLCHFYSIRGKQEANYFELGTPPSLQRNFDSHLREPGKHYCLFKEKDTVQAELLVSMKMKWGSSG